MSKKMLLFFAVAALIGSARLAAEDEPATQQPSGDTTVATINGQKIPLDLFRRFYVNRLRQAKAENTPDFQNRAFNELVNVVVTAQDARREGLDKTKDYELARELQDLRLLSNFALQHAASARKPTEEELKKAYDERYRKDNRREYKARQIQVQDEKEAKAIIKELDKGADFAELAKARSQGSTSEDGGMLPWFGADGKPSIVKATAALKPGEYTHEPVKTEFGWHILLLEETREVNPPAFDDVKDELAAALQRFSVGSYVAELREKADLDVNPDLVKITERGNSELAPAESQSSE